jgi:uncharacterized protein YoxC
MTLLMTLLTVLGIWAFLVVLAVGLLLIEKVLESVRGYLEKITMGVRAIEKETEPLNKYAALLVDRINRANQVVGAASQDLAQVDTDLGTAANLLRPG